MLLRERTLAADLAAKSGAWLTSAMCRPDPKQGFSVHVVHEGASHGLAVLL